jgi:hypothetical protein
MKTLITRTITINMTRDEKIEGTAWGYRKVPDGTLTGVVELSVDAEEIFKQLAVKALRSKGRKARALSGAVDVRATCIRRIRP